MLINNMAGVSDGCDNVDNLENLKISVRKSFARLYAAVKARELRTLRQLEAIGKQCQNDHELERKCVQNIHISFDVESTLLDNINNFGVIDLKRLSFDNVPFSVEDYVAANDDHMYSYKCIGQCEQSTENNLDLRSIEEAALRQVTSTTDCVCYVTVQAEEASKQFGELKLPSVVKHDCDSSLSICEDSGVKSESTTNLDENINKIEDTSVVKKINPTDDWLNLIKTQTETEPVQPSEVMEHSTITCT